LSRKRRKREKEKMRDYLAVQYPKKRSRKRARGKRKSAALPAIALGQREGNTTMLEKA